MDIPHVKFRYSWIYDQTWRRWLSKENPELIFPTEEEVKEFASKIEPVWKAREVEILTMMSSLTQLPWCEQEAICYIVSRCRPFSDPLTMRVTQSDDEFMRFLIHEIIHQNLTQGLDDNSWEKAKKMFKAKYSDETITTKNHILVHAFLKQLLLNLYDQSWVDKDIEFCNKFPEYKRAWEIVENEGYEKIAKDFINFIKS